mmetsp:Transcript_103638/g.332174  ORF Transcript_103638/g.332174 Transcript_103638/m.332174 type:complete len:222 (+) Transcript_103638:3319-3984(+)
MALQATRVRPLQRMCQVRGRYGGRLYPFGHEDRGLQSQVQQVFRHGLLRGCGVGDVFSRACRVFELALRAVPDCGRGQARSAVHGEYGGGADQESCKAEDGYRGGLHPLPEGARGERPLRGDLEAEQGVHQREDAQGEQRHTAASVVVGLGGQGGDHKNRRQDQKLPGCRRVTSEACEDPLGHETRHLIVRPICACVCLMNGEVADRDDTAPRFPHDPKRE